MKKIIFSLVLLMGVVFSAHAGFEAKSGSTSLGVVNKLKCSTGLTCTANTGGQLTMVSDVVADSIVNADVNTAAAIAYSKLNLTGSLVEGDVTAQVEGLNAGRLAIFDYDFAVDGGTIGTIATGVTLPIKAVIEKCWFRVETQLVDGGAGTLAVQCEDADNILTAADQTGVAAGAFLASNVTGTAANMVDDIAAACDISYVIAGADLTAGKIRGYCRYSVHE